MGKHVWIIALALVMISSAGFAQEIREFKPFKVGLGMGYGVPTNGEGAGGGVLFFVEPAYRVTDQIQAGLRLESAVIVRGVEGVNSNEEVAGDAAANMSYTLNGQYYFSEEKVRPFVGAGFGLFSLAEVEFNTTDNDDPTTDEVSSETAFGFYPRVGVDVGHFILTVDYNIIPSTDVDEGGEIKNNYLGIRVGFNIGGGRVY